MIAGVHLGLDLDDLAVAGDAIGIHFDERIALAKELDEGIDLLCLERTVERYLALGFSSFDQNFLALIGRKLGEFGKNLAGGFRARG
jgi:hypothetical protein